jgi:hypothetical protein
MREVVNACFYLEYTGCQLAIYQFCGRVLTSRIGV